MKKIKIMFLLTCTSLLFAACGNSEDTTNNSSSTSMTEQSTSTKEDTTEAVDSKNASVVEELDKQFNTDGEKIVDITLEKDVVDSESDDPHEVITVEVVDETTRKNISEADSANNSNSATDEQKLSLRGIQEIVSSQAKNLKGVNDSIMFTYLDEVGNSMVVAYSTNSKDIIPLVD